MTTYAEEILADRRLVMLRLLLEDEGCANDKVLEVGLRAVGHRVNVDRDYVRDQMAWLNEARCIRIEYAKDRVMVAHLTDRGAAVARGDLRVEGIARPSFGG